ncbi:hypothetical protein BGZ99_000094 [Dissophora globulifera]|uniref:tRNA-5-taurinomethyluridine 2-sulfurtransferase n=1 Tax=Dissophora globulifera TaxID=979702 RepID=A0A9P6V0H2_9FUNG|nr:hypothetical protein BGZ99_000094 [Dissophora globulifera]
MAALHRADTRMTAAAGQFLTTFRQFVTFRCPTQPRLRAASLTLVPRSTFSTSSFSKSYYSSARPTASLTRLSLRQRPSHPRNRLVQHHNYLSVASAPSSDHVTSHDPPFPTSRTPNVLASNTSSSTTAEHPRRKERVLLLMSGGVDSSMCAYILHNKGYDVTGLYMHNWNHQEETQDELPPPSSSPLSPSSQASPHQSSNDTLHLTESPSSTSTSSRTARIRPKVCTSDRDWADVQAVCSQLGIPARRLDFSREYWNQVFEVMLHEYERGRTPNPDVTCNKEIKFGELIEWCQRNGGLGKDRFLQDMSLSTTRTNGGGDSSSSGDEHAIGWDYLATGHYARVELDPVTGHARLMRALDSNKDQTYYLSTLSERVLRHAIFPLAQYDKPTVKRMAMAEGTPLQVRNAAQKKESMGICFVGQRRRFGEFLKEYLDVKPGPVCVNGVGGQVIGEHKGLFRYTVGQASGVAHGSQKWVVLRMDMPSNTLVVVDGT